MAYQTYFNNSPAPIERIIGALSYCCPLIGLVWLIIAAVIKRGVRPFLLYHIYQSIFLAFSYFILGFGLSIIMRIIHFIPFINKLTGIFTFYLNVPLLAGFSIIGLIILIIVTYLALGALLGRHSYFPWVSELIKSNIRG